MAQSVPGVPPVFDSGGGTQVGARLAEEICRKNEQVSRAQGFQGWLHRKTTNKGARFQGFDVSETRPARCKAQFQMNRGVPANTQQFIGLKGCRSSRNLKTLRCVDMFFHVLLDDCRRRSTHCGNELAVGQSGQTRLQSGKLLAQRVGTHACDVFSR